MTTHKEALTLALEALCTCGPQQKQAITAIKEALAKLDKIAALQQKTESHDVDCLCSDCAALDDLDEALAQPEQEPVAHVCVFPLRGDEFFPQTRIEWKNGRPVAGPLYTTPPQRKPLTDEQRRETINRAWNDYLRGEGDDSFGWYLSQAIEAAHGIKGEA